MPLTELDGVIQLFTLLLVGIGFFSVLIFIMTVIFGISSATFLNNKSGLVAFLLLSLSLPVLVYGIQNRTLTNTKANNINIPENLKILPANDKQSKITFTTNNYVIAYLLIEKDDITQVILPSYKLKKINNHNFTLENTVFERYSVYIIIDGEKYQLNYKI